MRRKDGRCRRQTGRRRRSALVDAFRATCHHSPPNHIDARDSCSPIPSINDRAPLSCRTPLPDWCLRVAGNQSALAHSFGLHWVYTIADTTWHPPTGERVAVLGPLAVTTATSYTARYMEAVFPPDRGGRPPSFGSGSVVCPRRRAMPGDTGFPDHRARRQRRGCPVGTADVDLSLWDKVQEGGAPRAPPHE